MPLPLFSIIAEVLPPADSATSTGWLFVGLGGLALTANQFLGFLSNLRKLRQPEPVNPQDGARIKALEEEMKSLELRMERRMGEVMGSINTRLQSLENTISHLVSDFSRALGVLEGKAELQSKRDNSRD